MHFVNLSNIFKYKRSSDICHLNSPPITLQHKKVLLRERKWHTARRVASAHFADGGVPQVPPCPRFGCGGYPIQFWMGDTLGSPPSQVWMGDTLGTPPHPRSGQGEVSHPVLDRGYPGYPIPGLHGGTPSSLGWGCTPSSLGWRCIPSSRGWGVPWVSPWSQVLRGVPHPVLDGGYPGNPPPSQVWTGGYPMQSWTRGYPIKSWTGGYPGIPSPHLDLRWGTPPRKCGKTENNTFRHPSDASGKKRAEKEYTTDVLMFFLKKVTFL